MRRERCYILLRYWPLVRFSSPQYRFELVAALATGMGNCGLNFDASYQQSVGYYQISCARCWFSQKTRMPPGII
jgi:hypothetical protein